jgi:hypothetical protein
VKRSDGACDGSLGVVVTSDGTEQVALDPFVASRVERARTTASLTKANELFKAGKVDEARATLSRQQAELARVEATTTATASAAPAKAKGASLDQEFAQEHATLATAQANIAATALPATTAPQASPQGQAATRANAAADYKNGY